MYFYSKQLQINSYEAQCRGVGSAIFSFTPGGESFAWVVHYNIQRLCPGRWRKTLRDHLEHRRWQLLLPSSHPQCTFCWDRWNWHRQSTATSLQCGNNHFYLANNNTHFEKNKASVGYSSGGWGMMKQELPLSAADRSSVLCSIRRTLQEEEKHLI